MENSGPLVKALWADQLRVKYAAGGPIDVGMPTSIHVEGAGDLALPLSGENVLKLKAVSTQAPYGRGAQTLVDTDVRRAWQIEASKVSCPQSPDFLSQVARDLAAPALMELGVDADALGLEVRLYKLLLYEQGGHFKVHRDSEKEVGMFATMILQLPTESGHEGGQLKVCHGDQSILFDFSGAGSTTGYFKTVFFCDCEHSLAEVTSGSRLCMAFNLVRTSAKLMDVEALRLPHYISALGEVQKQLKQWADGVSVYDPDLPVLAIPLGHCYSKNSLSFAGLKGYDRVVTALVLSCTSFLDVHLCMFKKDVLDFTGSGGYVEETYEIISWMPLGNRTSTLESCKFNIENVVSHFASSEDPNQKPEEFDLGNEGAGFRSLYYAAGLVVWPKHHRGGALCRLQWPKAVVNWIDEQNEHEPERRVEDFRCFLASYLEGRVRRSGCSRFGEEDCDPCEDPVGYILDFCLRNELRDDAFKLMRRKSSDVCKSAVMVSVIQKYGWEVCYREVIQKALNLSTEWSGLCALPRRLQEKGLQDGALIVAKQMIIRKDLQSTDLSKLLEFYVGCGLEEEAWLIVDNPSFFDADSMAKIVKEWGEKSLTRIEQKLSRIQEQEKRSYYNRATWYYNFRDLSFKDMGDVVMALDREGCHEAALAFSKMFLSDAQKFVLNARSFMAEEEILVVLLSCHGQFDEVVAVVRAMTHTRDLTSVMKEAANLIGLKKDAKVTELYAELLSEEMKKYYAPDEILDVLDRVGWLGDEKVIADMLTWVEKYPLMVLEAFGMREPYLQVAEPLDVEALLKKAKAWDNVGKNGLKKVVKVLLDFIASESKLCDAKSDQQEGGGVPKRLKVTSQDERIQQDLRLETAAAKTERLLKILSEL